MIRIRKREDISVEDLIRGKEYLGAGASKEAFGDETIVYKIPRGRHLIEGSHVLRNELKYPISLDDLDRFLQDINDEEPAMVWPLGQCALEIIVWEALKILAREYDVDISHFAPIVDYYLDRNGILVIEQARTHEEPSNINWTQKRIKFDELEESVRVVNDKLQDIMDFALTDIRMGNCGFNRDGVLQVFDFGLSKDCGIREYSSYDCYMDDYYNSYDYCSDCSCTSSSNSY